jgi:hypothetical protein
MMIQSTIDYYWDFICEHVEPSANEGLRGMEGYQAAAACYAYRSE